MNRRAQSSADDPLTLEDPLEALRASPEFQGTVESLDTYQNDHLASLYHSTDERFSVAIPFIRQGIERGERCLYVVEENATEDVRARLRKAGIDVESALESGLLTFETVRNTYLRDGTFDDDEMLSFYADRIDETSAEYDGFRVIAEMSWILETDVAVDEIMAYESKVNTLFEDEDAVAICQYDCEAFPPDVLCDVIRVHPHLVFDDTVCHNFYYIPPDEFCGPERPARELDRMLGTLRDRADARVELQDRKGYLQRQNEIIADPARSFDEKLQALFDLGCERFDLELGAMARVDTDEDWFEVDVVSDEHEHFEPGVRLPLSETYCTAATDIRAAGSVSDPEREGYDDIFVYQEYGIRAYLGTYVGVENGTDRTFFFVSSNPRSDPFSDVEHTFIQSMGQWVKYELERQQRERKLERREQRYQTLAESFPNGAVTMLDTEGRFTLAAGRMFDELPIFADETEGETIEEAWGEAVASVVEPAYEDALTGEERVVDVEYADREWRIHIVPIEDENDAVFAAMAMTQDVTQQKERERFLQEAKSQLEAATEAGAVGTWEWHVPDDRFVAGASFARQFGVDPDEAREGVSIARFASSIYEEDRERVMATVQETMETCGECEIEYRVRDENGELRWVVARGYVECDNTGEPVRFPGALTDITERKEYQQRLEETIEKLEESNERLEQFAYAASHDLQEPLRMVSSYLRLIERRYEDDLDEDGEEFLEFAISGADRMRSMIDALLDYSRVETGGEPLEPVALEDVFEDVLDDLAIQIETSDADITADSLPQVLADRNQVRQLFQNLVDNAITYSGDEPPRIHVSAEREGSKWLVSVRDEGIGIHPDERERVFDVFHRLHGREKYPGSGIGLALCQRILERHGGDIWVDSEPGEGSTFSLTLPPVEDSDQ